MRKPAPCTYEIKGTYQLCGNQAADQCLYFPSIDIVQYLNFLNAKFQASSHILWLFSTVCVVNPEDMFPPDVAQAYVNSP